MGLRYHAIKHRESLKRGIFAALFLALPQTGWAAGTPSGTAIKNFATVDYALSATAPVTVASNTVQLQVDKKINLTVSEITGKATLANVGQNGAVTTFKVTNQGNDAQGYIFAAAVAAAPGTPAPNGTAPFITNDFNATIVGVFVDSNGNGTYDPLLDTTTNLPSLAADATSPAIFVVANIPTVPNGQQSVISLTAIATAIPGNPALPTPAVALVTANAANSVEVVYADTVGVADGARDGRHSAYAAYITTSLSLALTKVIANAHTTTGTDVPNPASGDPSLRPGSVLTYLITASFAGTGTINNLVITDPLPGNITYTPGSIKLNGVTQTDATDAIDNSSFSANTVSVAIGSVTAPAGNVVIEFQATIN